MSDSTKLMIVAAAVLIAGAVAVALHHDHDTRVISSKAICIRWREVSTPTETFRQAVATEVEADANYIYFVDTENARNLIPRERLVVLGGRAMCTN